MEDKITATNMALAFTYAALEKRLDTNAAPDHSSEAALTDAISLIDDLNKKIKRIQSVWEKHKQGGCSIATQYELENILGETFGW